MGNDVYYIGKRTPKRKNKFFVLCAIVLIAILTLNFRTYPWITAYAQSKLQTELSETVNLCISKELQSNRNLFSELVTIKTKSDGSISSLNVNTSDLLLARSLLVSAILDGISYYDGIQIPIPVGNISGINFLSGKGPEITVNTKFTNGFNAYFENDFSEIGINQTMYRIFFTVHFCLNVMLPSKTETVVIEQSFPVVSTVIVGEVPDAYTKIDRLTNDITEGEIDDIYDFGASIQ